MPTTRQYRIYNPETGTVERYSTVCFDEERKGGTLPATPEDTPPPPETQGRPGLGQHVAGWRHYRGEGTIAGDTGGQWGTDAFPVTVTITVAITATATVTITASAARAHARRQADRLTDIRCAMGEDIWRNELFPEPTLK
jgi:hypothetical protein